MNDSLREIMTLRLNDLHKVKHCGKCKEFKGYKCGLGFAVESSSQRCFGK